VCRSFQVKLAEAAHMVILSNKLGVLLVSQSEEMALEVS
jgi:hypothetical protein